MRKVGYENSKMLALFASPEAADQGLRFWNSQVTGPDQIEQSVKRKDHQSGDHRMPNY